MLSNETLWRRGLLAALGACLVGCASVGETLQRGTDVVMSAVAAPAAAAPAPEAKAAPIAPTAAAAPVPAKAEPQIEVSPAVQRAFDDARKALRAGRTDDAERAFRALTKSNPELGGPHANLGLIYTKAGKLPEAVAELELAVLASPQQPVYFNQLGIAYRHNGQFTKARDAYEKAVALDANYAAPYLNLAILNDMYLWDGKRALEYYDRYLALSPGEDSTVAKWVADLKNRKREHSMVSKKEQQ